MDEAKPFQATVEHREPCDSRGSCTVLGAPGGEIPPGDSTTAVHPLSCGNWLQWVGSRLSPGPARATRSARSRRRASWPGFTYAIPTMPIPFDSE